MTNSKRQRFISPTSICWTHYPYLITLLSRLCKDCWKCKATLPHIMFTSASTSLMTAAPLKSRSYIFHSVYCNVLLCTSAFIPCCSSALSLRLTWLWHWHPLRHLSCEFFVLIKATKDSLMLKTATEYVTAQVCCVLCVCLFVCVYTTDGRSADTKWKHPQSVLIAQQYTKHRLQI